MKWITVHLAIETMNSQNGKAVMPCLYLLLALISFYICFCFLFDLSNE